MKNKDRKKKSVGEEIGAAVGEKVGGEIGKEVEKHFTDEAKQKRPKVKKPKSFLARRIEYSFGFF